MQFTDLAIRALKAPETGYAYVWDSALKGFGIRISAKSGSKTFCVLIGKGRRQTIGQYGPKPHLSLAEAREEARRILAEKTLGRVRPKHTAYEDARDDFLKECEARLRPLTVGLYRRHLTVHYAFGRKGVGDLTPRDIVKQLNRLNDRPSEKEHAARIGRTFFNWCVGQQLIDRSPMETIARPPTQPSRERVLSEKELAAVYTTALKAENAFQRLILLLTLTGCRRGELTRLKWSYIAADTISLPPEITKGKREHTFPIGPKTQELLSRFPRLHPEWVFPAAREQVNGKITTVMTGYSAAKRAFDKDCGVTDWTPHDLRRTMTTIMCDQLDIAPHIPDRLIAHKGHQPSAAAPIYNRARYMKQMRDAAERWEEYLTMLTGTSAHSAQAVNLRSARS